jgi:transposase
MRTYTIILALSGDHSHQVVKTRVPVTEVVLLAHIHGGSASIAKIWPDGEIDAKSCRRAPHVHRAAHLHKGEGAPIFLAEHSHSTRARNLHAKDLSFT